MGKINNLRDLILTGGRTSETGIQNYIEKLSESDSKLNLDMLDEVVTGLENIYLYNQNACDNEESSTKYHGNNIECRRTNKYIDLFNDLYQNAKSKWKTSNCYKNQHGQCINFNELISHWAPNLYQASRNTNQNGSSSINFLYKHYSKKYSSK
jgi:hypothetical protein